MVIEETIKRRVIQLWLSGEARDKIAADNNIEAGTVSAIVDNYKIGFYNLDLDSFILFNYLVKLGHFH